ncbi:MAG: flagellar basal body-associated FliL family protein [Candidatus Marinimicrobia bacterium]|nr:flagellar basal body-associated FliL family protein [Candidatus Neomarinimicrobiota bacterium]
MAEEVPQELEAEAEIEEASPGLSPVVKIIILVLVMSVLSLGAFFISKSLLWPKYQAYKEAKEMAAIEQAKNEVPTMGIIHIIDNITVNTLGSGGRRYVIAEIALEVADQMVVDEIVTREPQIRDMFIRYLRRQTAQHVLDLGFQERSRRDLTKMLNNQLNAGRVDSLYYVKLLLQ